jgi:hypothetical protein
MTALSYSRTSGHFFSIPQIDGSQARRRGRGKRPAISNEHSFGEQNAKAENLVQSQKQGANRNKLKGLRVLPLCY